ncbi:hypothetical protein SNE40_020201 [Patella caerulea]|uniref:Uncharacterized protein n=1 Tax=Patella caerulea TaxID=87958 RepID=A0AAN8IYB9_PATCE
MSSHIEEQAEEIEALKAIYGDDLTEITSSPPCFMVHLSNIEAILPSSLQLKITLPTTYPSVVPIVEIPMRSNILTNDECQQLVTHLLQQAEENIGMAMIFTLVDNAQDWINEHIQVSQDKEVVEEEPVSPIKPKPVKICYDVKSQGGKWDYVLGLVGKPSAGKSTFFNAATNLELAKTGAHPFTTIEPNIGRAFYSIPCPCQNRNINICNAAHGHNHKKDRYIPVLLKDVAGLVPGASQGKGRGNRFLNDLLDADVLVHIVDVSGKTNEKGEETTDYDPSLDITWIQNELHQWIYDNVMVKWDNIKRKPEKLIDMFTGYHASKSLIFKAFQQAGITEKELSVIGQWKDDVLHNLVSEFLQLRFPMLVVLNKCDKPTSSKHIQRIQELYPDLPCIPVSSDSESYLQTQMKLGNLLLDTVLKKINLPENVNIDVKIRADNIQNNVLDRYGPTNVHEALCKAVGLKKPVYAYPVTCLDTFKSISKSVSIGHRQADILRDCISLKPSTTVEELYAVLKHHPVSLITGDFVRAETVDKEGCKRPVKKDEKIDDSNYIIKIMTTKRSTASSFDAF